MDSILSNDELSLAMIFVSTKRHTEQLAEELQDQGHRALALHGDMNQRQRTRTLARLRKGSIKILVATDVASRGIDVEAISHVINFDLPRCIEDYVHRIGRTARAGQVGPYYCTVLYDKEEVDIDALEDGLKELLGKSTKSSSRKRYQRSSSSSSSNATSAL